MFITQVLSLMCIPIMYIYKIIYLGVELPQWNPHGRFCDPENFSFENSRSDVQKSDQSFTLLILAYGVLLYFNYLS